MLCEPIELLEARALKPRMIGDGALSRIERVKWSTALLQLTVGVTGHCVAPDQHSVWCGADGHGLVEEIELLLVLRRWDIVRAGVHHDDGEGAQPPLIPRVDVLRLLAGGQIHHGLAQSCAAILADLSGSK